MKYASYIFLLLIAISCGVKEEEIPLVEPIEPEDFTAQNEMEISQYLIDNDLVSQKSETGLHYIIENQGDGAQATLTSNATVLYKGYFLDGTVFDENTSEGFTADLNTLILGFGEGVSYFNEGGNGVLFIPAHLAYGSFYFNGIPGGSVLIFEITLVSIN